MANPNNGKSKFDQATDRARGVAPESSDAGGSGPQLVTNHPLIREGVTVEDIHALRAKGDLEFAPQVYKLKEGDQISGILEGNGPIAEIENIDRSTKEVKVNHVNTWIVASPDGGERISILSSVQLDRKLPPFVGGPVTIIRGQDINTNNGQRVTDYLVCGPKLANGERRSFVMKPSPKVLDVPADQAQLPAGSGHDAAQMAAPSSTQPVGSA